MNKAGRKILRRLVRNSATTRRTRRGQEIMILCPFHKERTPSCSINVDNGSYYCFGCHAKGTIYELAREHPSWLGRRTLQKSLSVPLFHFPDDDDLPF